MPEVVKPHHLVNAYTHACKRAEADMRLVALSPDLPVSTCQMARQALDLIVAVAASIQPKDTN